MSSQDTYFLCLVSVTDFTRLQLFKPCGQNISGPILHQGSLSCLITKKQRILALCLQPNRQKHSVSRFLKKQLLCFHEFNETSGSVSEVGGCPKFVGAKSQPLHLCDGG